MAEIEQRLDALETIAVHLVELDESICAIRTALGAVGAVMECVAPTSDTSG